MTSFDFVTAGCGGCHPGGGPMEYDRNGKRYDDVARDPVNGIKSGGDNGFDGDYFKARWAETGVIEADCLLCHLPAYNNQKRKEQIKALNFRWAATVGAGFGEIKGETAKGEKPHVAYDPKLFKDDGKVALNIVRDAPSKNCLFCHQETDWKKKGASYNTRTDVHIRAGLRCIDCHLTGSLAVDKRIQGKEVHQIGKGDDPGGLVRNDLDDTMRTCADCHSKGLLNAPVMKHRGLPPRHLEKIACQTCHIPARQVKAALIQDSTVFNSTPRIEPPPKRIWSFYGPDAKPWNYYGEVDASTAGYQPLHTYAPVVGWYKGKIYPLTRLYSIWLGIEEEGKKGLSQPYMKDMFKMWSMHRAEPEKNYPELKSIRDDNGDGFPEVDRTAEIYALLSAVTAHLRAEGESLEGKRVVFVKGDQVTPDGVNWRTLPRAPHEYSPYGSVFKFSHDVSPARAALGSGGCKDCHSSGSGFFFKPVLVNPFDEKGNVVTQANFKFLGLTSLTVNMGVFQQETLRPLIYWGLLIVLVILLLHYIIFGPRRIQERSSFQEIQRFSVLERVIHYSSLVTFLGLAVTGYLTLSGAWFSADSIENIYTWHHYFGYGFVLAVFLLLLAWFRDACFERCDAEWLERLGGYFGYKANIPASRFNAGQKLFFWLALVMTLILAATGFILIWSDATNLRQVAVTIHGITVFLFTAVVLVHVYLGTIANPGTLRSIFEGKVSKEWAEKHHPQWKPQSAEGEKQKR
ncbi:MAG: formate dehydrogenase subunit gamma [Thermodesulfobacteriota bacterium]|nr:formate dehydrogenase subunit gamma [Thermodesulfobacteriota bacterium]